MLAENIILIGFMGAGKSTVADELVKSGMFRLIDLDAEIERKAGMTIKEIFRQRGESTFRDLESSTLQDFCGKNGVVVATGGGIMGRPENRELIHKIGHVVYLRASFPELKKRLTSSGNRPLVTEQPDWNALETLLLSRIPFYEEADLIIDTDRKSPGEISREIMQKMLEV